MVVTVNFPLQHRDTPENNADTPFELTQKNLEVSKQINILELYEVFNIWRIYHHQPF